MPFHPANSTPKKQMHSEEERDMSDTRKIDIGMIIKRNDDKGRPYTRTLPDGTIVPSPLIVTRNYGVPSDVEIRFSYWDLDEQSLQVRLSGQKSQDEFDAFAKEQHDRMQQLVQNGEVDSMIRDHENQQRIMDLEAQIARNGGRAND